jgi:hypothetical protein
MIVTEEEAKTKRCQESFGASFVRMRNVDTSQVDYILPPINCLGSACMAWRWRTEAEVARLEYECTKGPPPLKGKPEEWTFVEGDEKGASYSRPLPAKPGTGYCGKAGHW